MLLILSLIQALIIYASKTTTMSAENFSVLLLAAFLPPNQFLASKMYSVNIYQMSELTID